MAFRKCSICGADINVDKNKELFFVDLSTKNVKHTHVDCFINVKTNLKRGKKTVEWCEEFIKEQREKEKNSLERQYSIERIYAFIQDNYGISFFPTYFYTKMSNIFNGTYKGLTKPMEPEDLYDMWIQKINQLDKIAENNRRKGNEITGLGRVNYDLAILLSKYDSYLQWKERQKLALTEVEEKKKTDINKVKYEDINRQKKKIENKSSVDINSMLDEI